MFHVELCDMLNIAGRCMACFRCTVVAFIIKNSNVSCSLEGRRGKESW